VQTGSEKNNKAGEKEGLVLLHNFKDCKGDGKETHRPPDMHWQH
jgi:hypothetical protein